MADGLSDQHALKNIRIWGSDLIADAIREQEVPYVCLNPGSSYRGLHDSLVNYLGNDSPKMLVCLHEEHAVAMAQGYAMVTGKPLIAIVHSNVGLMHATMAVYDAWCARVPVVLLGATGPVDSEKRRPQIDWLHTSLDQGALIRNYVKWDAQPASPVAAVESLRRAFNIARTAPCGPVYVNIPVEVQEVEVERIGSHDISRFNRPALSGPAKEDLDRATQWLLNAKNVLIISGRIARNEAAWSQRLKLAETLGAKVISGQAGASFPTHHPLHIGGTNYNLGPKFLEAYRSADVILSLDPIDLGGHLKQAFPPGNAMPPKIIHCSVDYQIHNGWAMDHQMLSPADLHIPATPEILVDALLDRLPMDRRQGYSYEARPLPKIQNEFKGEIGVADLAAVFRTVIGDGEICLLGKPLGWPPDATPVNHYLDYIGGNGGGGLGCGPAIAVGGALGLRDMGSDRLPVAILGDGDYLMGSSALWTAAANEIPILMIIANNRSYFNDERHQAHMAKERGRPEENASIGLRIEDPAPDCAMIARGHGIEAAVQVTNLADLQPALKKAIAAVRSGKSYLLEVIVRREYVTQRLTTH